MPKSIKNVIFDGFTTSANLDNTQFNNIDTRCIKA